MTPGLQDSGTHVVLGRTQWYLFDLVTLSLGIGIMINLEIIIMRRILVFNKNKFIHFSN